MGVLSLLLLVVSVFVTIGEAEANPASFLISCGTNTSVNLDGRRWVGDLAPSSSNFSVSSGIVASNSIYYGDPLYGPLYKTARIFTNTLNYTFKLNPGSYYLRLHFYPLSFQDYNANQSFFSVQANGLKLVSKFNVPGEVSLQNSYLQNSGGNSTPSAVIKEYFLNADLNSFLIEFIPSKDSFGFVNAIELVPVVDALFVDSANKVSAKDRNTGIQTMYRLNVGGPELKPREDELWRRWGLDSSYMLTANAGLEIKNSSNITYASTNDTSVAPLLVYETARTMSNNQVLDKRFNMSWKFEVDPGFEYLIRLHFCELDFDKANQRIFRIYINNRTAADNVDIFVRAGGKNKAYHHDFPGKVSQDSSTLWIQLGPDTSTGAFITDAFLNGLEIFKVSQNGNLAHVQRYSQTGGKKSSKSLILWAGIGAGLASIATVAAVILLVTFFCKRQRNKSSDSKNHYPGGWRPFFLHAAIANATIKIKGSLQSQNPNGFWGTTRVERRFTLTELKAATNNFDDGLVIGVGGFGKVYKGETEAGTLMAIKRANPQSQQGLTEFETEIEMLSRLRHRHLVSMIGFCEEHNEMILVYEYMSNGTLRSHLFGGDLPPLSWKQRLEACIGAARGLHYLHTGSDLGIIHRDVKTTNILLDDNFVAKMADFGLSKNGPSLDHTHVSTAVKGSFGYLDPEYFRRQQLTEKSDVYSFGVVLFEVICARAVINPSLPRDQVNLAEWAMRWQRQRKLDTIIDPRLKGKYSPESFEKFAEIAEKCLADEGKCRPTMGEVLWHLEYALQVHDAWLQASAEENCAMNPVLGTLEEKGDKDVNEEDTTVHEEANLARELKDDKSSLQGHTG